MSDSLIIDSMEHHLLWLFNESIRSYIGDSNNLVGINEMSRVEILAAFQNKRRDRVRENTKKKHMKGGHPAIPIPRTTMTLLLETLIHPMLTTLYYFTVNKQYG